MSRRLFRSAPRQRRLAARTSADTRAAAAGLERTNRWLSTHVVPALGILLALLILVFGGTLLFGSQFKVHEVQVVGAKLIDERELQNSVKLLGRSILLFNPGKVETALREKYVVLAKVSVGRQLPDKVYIHIEEQPARWAWESSGKYWWLRADGSVIGEMPDAGRLVVVHDIMAAFSQPEGYIPGVPWKLADAMLQALPVIPAFDYSVSDGLVVYVTEAQWPVYLGTGGDAQRKAEVLRALVKELTNRKAQVAYIDLRNESNPFYKKQAKGA
ncbi:MAG: cell division protein FtsQ/DivIB [Anaerolineae bacterium]